MVYDHIDVQYFITKWTFWKGIAIGSFITLIALTSIGLLFGR